MKELNPQQTEHVAGALRFGKRPPITTLAIGEEGGAIITTMMVGEEGGGKVTTLALGEEGSGGTTTVVTSSALGSF
jgi:hypothetical protein